MTKESKEKFRQTKKNKLYSKEVQSKMQDLKRQGHSREKACEILNVPLVGERSWRRYTNGQTYSDQPGTATCTFNRPFNFITSPTRVDFEKSVVSMFRQRSTSSQTTLELCCKEVMKLKQFKDDPHLRKLKFGPRFTKRLMVNHGLPGKTKAKKEIETKKSKLMKASSI